jgi:hypothetical protein
MTGPELRASDEDRQQVIRALERHATEGRLSLDEYADRVDRTLAARTHGQLAEITSDLPAEPTPPPDRAGSTGSGASQLGVAFLLALLALIAVGGLLLLAR